MLGECSAAVSLFWVSMRRLVKSRQTVVSLVLLGFACVAVMSWAHRRDRSPAEFTEQVFLTLFSSLLLPVFCLSYGTAGIASDREERTLVYLLVSPLPRSLVFASKALASMVPAVAWSMGGLATICWLAGSAGRTAWPVLWPSILATSIAYSALFLLFSVLFQRATLLALAYALFLETLVGNLPGIAKRLTISFYSRCQIFAAAEELDLRFRGLLDPEVFLPVSGQVAQFALWSASCGLLAIGLAIFRQREYT
ncbi:MAG: ABC transporter permease subunit [Planctomycetota bacterium]